MDQKPKKRSVRGIDEDEGRKTSLEPPKRPSNGMIKNDSEVAGPIPWKNSNESESIDRFDNDDDRDGVHKVQMKEKHHKNTNKKFLYSALTPQLIHGAQEPTDDEEGLFGVANIEPTQTRRDENISTSVPGAVAVEGINAISENPTNVPPSDQTPEIQAIAATVVPEVDDLEAELARYRNQAQVQATPVDNQESQEENFDNQKSFFSGKNTIWLILTIAAVATIATIVAVFFSRNTDKEENTAPSLTTVFPTSSPTNWDKSTSTTQPTAFIRTAFPTGTTRLDEVRSVLVLIIYVSVGDEDIIDASASLFTPDTPQYAALDWISNQDELGLELDEAADEHILERYVLALLYYSTNGPSWENSVSNKFISPLHVCNWVGVSCDSDLRVNRLHFANNNLVGQLPTELAMIKRLSGDINFTGNNLSGFIPSELGVLTGITYLYLNSNEFTGAIPSELGRMTKLYYLDIRGNSLTSSIPSDIGRLSTDLTRLYLNDNDLTGNLPSEIGRLTKLNELSVSNNGLAGAIPSELGRLSALRQLVLNNNKFTSLPLDELSTLPWTYPSYVYFEENDIVANINPTFCTRTSLVYRLQADCDGDPPEVRCSCCTLCGSTDTSLDIPQPTAAPVDPARVEAFLSTLQTVSSSEDLNQEGSPQEKALQWIAVNDEAQEDPEVSSSVIQRYVLAVFYYSTNGESWKNNVSNKFLTILHVCNWVGVTCDSDLNVQALSFPNNNLEGTLPTELAMLTSFSDSLQLNNNKLSGSIPGELGVLTGITYLYLSDNEFTGAIPSELGRMTKLYYLNLQENSLTSSIPSDIGRLSTDLTRLYLNDNDLTGNLPSEIGRLTKLNELYVSNNGLAGAIPSELGRLSALRQLVLNNNKFTSLPLDELSTLSWTYPSYVYFEENDIVANINPTFCTRTSLVYRLQADCDGDPPEVRCSCCTLCSASIIDGDNTVTDPVDPARVEAFLSTLQTVSSSEDLNQEGSPQEKALQWIAVNDEAQEDPEVSSSVIQRYILAVFYYSTNGESWKNNVSNKFLTILHVCNWVGVTCDSDLNVQALSFPNNNLEGTLPTELAMLTSFSGSLQLNNNKLSGSIPGELGVLTGITYLYLSDNEFTGAIPSELGRMTKLYYLNLQENSLTSSIPSDIGRLSTDLTRLYLNDNDLTGNLPSEIGRLTKLNELYVSNNGLAGAIPSELGRLSALRQLVLSNNKFTSLPLDELSALPWTYPSYVYFEKNDIVANIELTFCTRTSLVYRLQADCDGDPPEVICSCCSSCN